MCTNNIRDNNGSDEDDDSGDTWVYSLTPRKRGAYAKCRKLVNGKQLVFQIDTGATVNMLPARWRSHNVEQHDDKTAGEVSNAEQSQNGDIT